jgi:hypothetical protein
MAAKLRVYPAFYWRVRHYRDRIIRDGRALVATRFVQAAAELAVRILKAPQRGRAARFEPPDLADILRMAVQGFPVFAIFYRCQQTAER